MVSLFSRRYHTVKATLGSALAVISILIRIIDWWGRGKIVAEWIASLPSWLHFLAEPWVIPLVLIVGLGLVFWAAFDRGGSISFDNAQWLPEHYRKQRIPHEYIIGVIVLVAVIVVAVWLHHRVVGSAIDNLATLGWSVKTDAKTGMVFEVSGKPLPNMEKSVIYFRLLNNPFRLFLQQVPRISGLSLLSNVANFAALDIDASDVEDLYELRGLTNLHSLTVSETPLRVSHELDISAISALTNLENLILNSARVGNIESVRGFTKLVNLYVGETWVRDLSPVKNMKLKSVDVRGSNVTDLSVLETDTALEELRVDEKQVPSLVRLTRLPNLSKLTIIPQAPLNLSPVGGLRSLTFLEILDSPTIDMSTLRNLTKLTTLQIMGPFPGRLSRTIDVDAIGDLSQLKSLSLGMMEVTSLRFLPKCHNLEELFLENIPVSTINEVTALTSLKKISLIGLPVVDISPLLSLPNLEEVYLFRTPARSDVISELQRRGVKVTMP